MRRLDFSKTLRFGVIGAVGCLIGALIGEVLLLLLPLPQAEAQPNSAARPVEIVFVLDVTGSMQPYIDGVRYGIQQFVDEFSRRNLDIRFGLVAYRDLLVGEQAQVLIFPNGEPFTTNPDTFSAEVATLLAGGGGDTPESSLDALALAARQPFRSDAFKVLMLMTDAQPQVPDMEMLNLTMTADVLRGAGIHQLHLVIPDEFRQDYVPLQAAAPGEVFSLQTIAAGQGSFAQALPEIGATIAESIPGSVLGTQQVAAGSLGSLVLSTSLWTAALAIALSWALIIGQNAYLGRQALGLTQGIRGLLGGFGAGIVAGIFGQMFFSAAVNVPLLVVIGRVVAWGLLGMLLGWGMTLFIPNLKPVPARIGGAVGGVLGAAGFLLLATLGSDTIGRLLGAMVLGFCIGLVLVIVETAFREMYLEVRYGGGEVRTVSLGAEPILLGGDNKLSTVFIFGLPKVAFGYTLASDGQGVIIRDVTSQQEYRVMPGYMQQFGETTVQVVSNKIVI